jgi:hypothetical protein
MSASEPFKVVDLDADIVELAPCPAPAAIGGAPLREIAFQANAWLPAETDQLIAMFNAGDPLDDIAAAIGRGREAVRSRAWELGLRRHTSRAFSDVEDAEISARYGAEPAARIAQDLGRSAFSIYNRAAVLGVSQVGAPAYEPWEDAQIRAGYAAAAPIGQIAALIGRSPLGVVHRAGILGLSHPAKPADYSDAELARMLELAHVGAPYAKIREQLVAEGFPRRSKAGFGSRLRKIGYGRGWGRRWSPDEDALLKAAYAGGNSLTALARHLARGKQSVIGRAAYIGLNGSHPSPDGFRGPVWTPVETERLAALYGTKPVAAIAQELGRPLRAVYCRAFHMGLNRPRATWTERENLAIRIGWAHGLPQHAVATAVGRNLPAVQKHVAKLGLDFDDPARPKRPPRGFKDRRAPEAWTLDQILALGLPSDTEIAA